MKNDWLGLSAALPVLVRVNAIGAVLLAFAGALAAQLNPQLPADGPVGPGVLKSYDVQLVYLGSGCTTAQPPLVNVPPGQLPLFTVTCNTTANDASGNPEPVTETFQLTKFTDMGDNPTPAGTANHASAIVFATPMTRTLDVEADWSLQSANPISPAMTSQIWIEHLDYDYFVNPSDPKIPPTDMSAMFYNSGGTKQMGYSDQRQFPGIFYEASDGCGGTTPPGCFLENRAFIAFYSGGVQGFEIELTAYYLFTSAAAPPPPTITINPLQVVQVIQNNTNSIPLVQYKTAEVRVYAQASRPVAVTATLSYPGNSAAAPITTYGMLGTSFPDPNSQQGTLNFEVDGPWVAFGNGTYQVDIQPADKSAPPVSKAQPVSFANTNWPQPYIVKPIVVCSPACAGGGVLENLDDFMQKVFPVPDATPRTGIVYLGASQFIAKPSITLKQLQNKLIVWYFLMLLLLDHPPDQLVAWVDKPLPAPGIFGMGILSHIGILYEPTYNVGSLNNSFNPSAFFEVLRVRALNEFYLASLVAYNLGAPMPVSQAQDSIDLTGFDPEEGKVISPIRGSEPELELGLCDRCSGYDDPSGWISSAQYNALFDAFNPTYPPSPAARKARTLRASDAAASPAQYLIISGDVSSDGSTAELYPGFLVSSTKSADPSDPNGNYCLNFSGPQGALSSHCFTVQSQPGIDPSPFGVSAPWPAGANRVGLVVNGGANNGQELASITANAQQPTVQITSPATGASLNAGTLNLSWTGSGSSPLTYNVLYSSDGGATWTPVDIGETDSTYAVDTTQIVGGNQVEFQVQASDGLNTAAATVGPLTITQTPHIALPNGTVDFHKVLIGQGLDQLIPLQNSGNGPLTVTSVAMDNASFRVVGPGTPFQINPGGQQSVHVRFTPTSPGVVTANLQIASSDPSLTNAAVPVRAEGITNAESTVNVGSATVDFGNVVVGQSTTASFPVGSFGPATLNISNIQSSNSVYSVTSPALPFSVPVGQQQSVTVQFAPTATGTQNAVLTLTTDDPDLPSAAVNTTGNGVAANSGTPSYPTSAVVNAASGQGGAVAPGEIVLVLGSNLGPSTLAGLQLSNGSVATSAGNTQVLFDSVPAPMIYSSSGQVAAVVPYEVWNQSFTEMQVIYNGVMSNVGALPVVASVPGLFTANSSGQGPGAILNQDGSVNSANNPAALGSVVILYGTGEGQTTPPGLDGSVTGSVLPSPLLPVSITIGGVNAAVQYAGEAPSLVAGVLQVNAVVPAGLTTGNQPVVVTVGSASSPAGVTVAVKGTNGPPPPSCTFSLSATSAGVPAAASAGNTVGVTASASSCAWTAVSNAPWITITSGASGSGNGTVTYSVAANTGAAQSGSMTIAGLAFSVNQAAATTTAPQISVTPAALNFSSVAKGSSKQLSLTVNNTGSGPLNVTALTAGGVFSVVSPAVPFTVNAGGTTSIALEFSPTTTGGQAVTLAIANNDPSQPNLSVPIWGTGYDPNAVLTSDSFNRANASECALGVADLKFGGSATYSYLPDWVGTNGPVGASIISGVLVNNGEDLGGVQLTTSTDTCNTARGASLPQDLDIIVDLSVPGSAPGHVSDAGTYFRSRSAAPGDGLFGGTSSGYFVELFSTGLVAVNQMNPYEPIAQSAVPASFNASLVHTLEARVQGATLTVTLDGSPVIFTQNGASTTTVSVSTAANNGAVGIIFSADQGRGQAGGQSASNLIISVPGNSQ